MDGASNIENFVGCVVEVASDLCPAIVVGVPKAAEDVVQFQLQQAERSTPPC